MKDMLSCYRGCLLGMAAGDALGLTIDDKSLDEIRESFGPNGLLGYDLQEQDSARISSYTQLAAYLCNGLLIALTRGKTDYVRYGRLALQEWTRSQQYYRDPEQTYCWVAKIPQFRRRYCRDARMLDNLRMEAYGTTYAPRNRNNAPGALPTAVTVGLFYDYKRLDPAEVGTLTAELTALTHGDPETFLTGVVLAYIIAGILQEPDVPLEKQFAQAIAVMDGQFRPRYGQAEELAQQLRGALSLAKSGTVPPREGMEQLGCMTAAQCLAGAMFACVTNPGDFDGAMITAVNHSGMSGAVGAVAGAVMGASMGEDALPAFYLDALDCGKELRILAEDMTRGAPALGIFDDSWDRKYAQGLPPEE